MKKHTLELTDEQIDKYGLRELVPFTGWAKTKEYNAWLGYFENNFLLYHISSDGKWFSFKDGETLKYNYRLNTDLERPATDEEIEKGLIGMAERLGFKKGVTFIDTEGNKQVATENPRCFYNIYHRKAGSALCCGNLTGLIFSRGKWAEIIEEPLTLEQRIEKIEKHLGL